MYESPIELIVREMRVEMDKKRDEAIWNAVEGIGVNVDKEELIKALQYDRDQYKKGYVDGVKAFAERLKTVLYMPDNRVIGRTVYTDEIDNLVKRMVGEE